MCFNIFKRELASRASTCRFFFHSPYFASIKTKLSLRPNCLWKKLSKDQVVLISSIHIVYFFFLVYFVCFVYFAFLVYFVFLVHFVYHAARALDRSIFLVTLETHCQAIAINQKQSKESKCKICVTSILTDKIHDN